MTKLLSALPVGLTPSRRVKSTVCLHINLYRNPLFYFCPSRSALRWYSYEYQVFRSSNTRRSACYVNAMEQQHNQIVAEDGWSYAKFVRRNPVGARSLESLIQYAGFFAPTRWADRDLAIESGYAVASLAALVHDLILLHGRLDNSNLGGLDQVRSPDRAPGSTSSTEHQPKFSPYHRRSQLKATTLLILCLHFVSCAFVVSLIVLEKLSGQHGGERRRRQAIMCIETLKAVSRLLLLTCTREMVVTGGVYVPRKRRSPQRRDQVKGAPWSGINPAESRTSAQPYLEVDSLPSTLPRSPEIYTGRRSGIRFVVTPRASVTRNGRGCSSRVCVGKQATSCDSSCSNWKPSGVCTACRPKYDGFTGLNGTSGRVDRGATCAEENSPLRQVQSSSMDGGGVAEGGNEPGLSQAWLMAGEVVHILRPLIYSYNCGYAKERSWRPWLVSLGMDAVAYACTARAGGGKTASLLPVRSGHDTLSMPYLDDEQAAELRRRKLMWFIYLMRSPAFQLLLEPLSRGAASFFDGVPLLSNMVAYALNMLLYLQRHHFYISAS